MNNGDLITLTEAELRELARLMNSAKRVDVGCAGMSLTFRLQADADRATDLLQKQGRMVDRINPVTLSVARRAR